MRNLKARQQGFTLVEMAIVMVIIGLLLGAVFKGQELVEQAKIKNTVKKIDEVRAAVYTYLDKYNALPGDDGNNNTPTTSFNGTTNDGQIEDPQVWEQLAAAGLISGGGDPIKTPYGTDMAVLYDGAGLDTNTICALVPTDVAQQIDTKYDDGDGTTGTIKGAGSGTAPATSSSAYAASGNNWICSKL